MFEIRTSAAFYRKLVDDYEEFLKDKMSSRSAINCAMTAYHLAEWVWGDWLKSNKNLRRQLGLNKVDDFKGWLDRETNNLFGAVQAITNGSKHFDKKAFDQTFRVEGYVEPGYVEKGYVQEGALLISVSKDEEILWNDFGTVIGDLVLFWRGFIRDHGPYAIDELPLPPTEVAFFEDGGSTPSTSA